MRRRSTLVVIAWLVCATPAFAQKNLQLWGNVTLDWVKSERLTYEVDFEPKVLVATSVDGAPGWHNLDLTPNVEYSPKGWLDLMVQATVGYTKQTDDVDTIELTPCLGARFHLFSRAVPTVVKNRPAQKELPPSRRIVVRDLVRVESRNFFYTGSGSGSSSSVRFRNRLEFQIPLNREKMSEDGVRYLLADWEWFVPLGDPEERFASKQRIRAGFGFRHSFKWRFEAIYMWTRSRNTMGGDFTTSDNIIDIRVKRFF